MAAGMRTPPTSRTKLQLVLAGASTILASVLAARLSIALNPPPWVTREYTAFAIWSAPLAVLVFICGYWLRRLLLNRTALIRTTAVVSAAIVLGVAYAFSVFYLSGGYVMAYDFPVLYCWTIGALVGITIACVGNANHTIPEGDIPSAAG
jgi:hypothetical protein